MKRSNPPEVKRSTVKLFRNASSRYQGVFLHSLDLLNVEVRARGPDLRKN